MSSSSKSHSLIDDVMIPGTVYVVGNGEVYGEVGMNEIREITYPIAIDVLEYEPIVDITSSSLHTLALDKHGKVWSWGCNEFGALGRTTLEEEEASPKPIKNNNVKFSKIACGHSMSMAVTDQGQLYTWGTFTSKDGSILGYSANTHIQHYSRLVDTLANINIIEIAAGSSHCLALSDQGKVYSWGDGQQLALGHRGGGGLVPREIPNLNNVVAIACGAFHSFAVNRYGQLFSWGLNHFQQCGLADPAKKVVPGDVIYEPTLVPYFSKEHYDYCHNKSFSFVISQKRKSLEANDDELSTSTAALAITNNKKPRLNHDNTNNSHFTVINDKRYYEQQKARIKSVSAGEYHTVILMDNNRLVVFGRCEGGQLGIPLYPNYQYHGAIKTKGITGQIYAIGYPIENLWRCEQEIKHVECGANHNLILTRNGDTYGFGHSGNFQLGLYDQQDVLLPTLIKSIHNIGRVINSSAGDRFTMFVLA